MIFRTWRFTDSMAFVVYIAFLIKSGYAKNGAILDQLRRQEIEIIGYLSSHF